MRDIVKVRRPLPEEQESGLLIGEPIRRGVAAGFLGHKFPIVQVFFRPGHGIGVAAPGVGQREKIKQPITDQPRQPDDFVNRLVPFQQE